MVGRRREGRGERGERNEVKMSELEVCWSLYYVSKIDRPSIPGGTSDKVSLPAEGLSKAAAEHSTTANEASVDVSALKTQLGGLDQVNELEVDVGPFTLSFAHTQRR